MAACMGELDNSNYTAVLLLHAVLLVCLIAVGIWLKVQNTLHSVAHYLEDTKRSNDLLVVCSWAPLLAYLLPMLFLGDAQGLSDTFMTVIGYFLLYVPVLDSPYTTVSGYTAYSCLAGFRIVRLSSQGSIPVSNFFTRTIVIGIGGMIAMHVRLRYLSKSRTPLTPQTLEVAGSDPGGGHHQAEEIYNPLHSRLRQRRPYPSPLPDDLLGGARGQDAARIGLAILRRRQQDKSTMIGQFLWAVHLFRKQWLSPDVLAHIMDFLDCSRSVTNYVGLLRDDSSSQVSSRQDRESSTHATSSLTSVTALQLSPL
ncbi:unnamed protein product [Symbiodinium pilosum]|uniref:Uncharacterized protein n=1 Tax=Symbiodinium pilosum TaxID=2952 RepID=A0A812UPZ8_SYMPI|nr:unnamed protein product [Symbiodinium pilosum]